MTPLRILMFARYLPPDYSGAAGQAFLLATRLRERGHRVRFAAISRSAEPRDYEVDGFPVTALAVHLKARHKELSIWKNLWWHLWAMRREIDLFHGHGAYYTNCIIGPFGRLLGKPSLIKASLANDDLHSLSEPRVATFHRALLSMVDAYVGISEDLRDEWLRRGMIPAKVHLIPNGVDLTRFRPADPAERAALAQELGLPTGRSLALCVGFFDRRKRIAWLAEQWGAHQGFGTGATLVAVGPTSREAHDSGLRRDLEAMACALPCVVARVSGSHELVQDGRSGATFPTDDADGLGEAIATVTGAPGEALGQAARALVVERFDIERVADGCEALYARILRSRWPGGLQSPLALNLGSSMPQRIPTSRSRKIPDPAPRATAPGSAPHSSSPM